MRLQNAAVSYVAYLVDAVWPRGLAVFYPLPTEPLPTARWAGAALLLAAATAAAAASWRRRPWLAVGWFWYVGTLVPMIGLVQFGMQARADRYTYLPLVGIAIAVAWGARELAARGPAAGRALAAAAAVALALLAGATRLQLAHWRDADALFARALAVTQDNFVAQHTLGRLRLEADDPDGAIEHLAEAVRLRPGWSAPRAALAEALARKGRLDEALWSSGEAVRLASDDAALRMRYAEQLLGRGWSDEAILQLRAARALAGDERERAQAEALLGAAWSAQGDPVRAAEHYERALALDPARPEARANLALARLEAGDLGAAAASLEAALAAGIDAPEVHAGLAEALARLGREAEAAVHYRQALAARPDWVEPANNLAWLLATAADPAVRAPEEALRWAERAARATARRDPLVLDTLAAAQAAAGQLEAARATLDEALARAEERGDRALAEALRARRAAPAATAR